MTAVPRPLVKLSATAETRREAVAALGHVGQLAHSFDDVLGRGLYDPRRRLLVVHCLDTLTETVHHAELELADAVAALGADRVRRQRPLVVDRHA